MNSAKTTNILNIHFGKSKIVKEECYPFLAYINKSSNPNGIMFDSFLFDFSKGETLSEWENQIEMLFGGDGGIRALDSAAADVKSLLNLPKDKGIDLYIKAPLPKISLKPFGDINRDGIIEKLLDEEDCLNAFSLFVSTVLRNFKISSPANLRLKGWFLDVNGKESIRISCADYLKQMGFDVYGSEVEYVELSTETDFSKMACQNVNLRVFSTETSDFLINCAFAHKAELRNVYDSLYVLLNPERFFEPAVEVHFPSDEAPEIEGELSIEETSKIEEELQIEDDLEIEEELQIEDDPEIEEELQIEEAPEIEEELPEELPEELFEELMDEIIGNIEAEEYAERTYESEIQPEIEEITEEIKVEISEEIAPENEKGKISVEISITEGEIPVNNEKKTVETPCKLTKKQKRTILGAGIAAAAMGIAYLIGKAKKEL